MKNYFLFYIFLGMMVVTTGVNSYDSMYYDNEVATESTKTTTTDSDTTSAASEAVSNYNYEEQELLDAFHGVWLDINDQEYRLEVSEDEIVVYGENDIWYCTYLYEVEYIDTEKKAINIRVDVTIEEGETEPDMTIFNNMIFLDGNTMTFVYNYNNESEKAESYWVKE